MFTRIRNIGIIIITTEITGQINHFAVYISHEILPCETWVSVILKALDLDANNKYHPCIISKSP